MTTFIIRYSLTDRFTGAPYKDVGAIPYIDGPNSYLFQEVPESKMKRMFIVDHYYWKEVLVRVEND